jgi:hypothetical protein
MDFEIMIEQLYICQKEVFMKLSLSRMVIMGTVIAFLFSFSVTALAGDKKVFSINLKSEKIVSEKMLHVYESFKVLVSQGESLYIIKDSNDPNLIGAEQTVYWQRDSSLGRGGIERGYTITRTKDGDVFYSRYEGTFKVIRKDFPKTEKQSSSKHQIFGGVKKFDGVNGSYSCDAIMNENKEEIVKCQGEWEF